MLSTEFNIIVQLLMPTLFIIYESSRHKRFPDRDRNKRDAARRINLQSQRRANVLAVRSLLQRNERDDRM